MRLVGQDKLPMCSWVAGTLSKGMSNCYYLFQFKNLSKKLLKIKEDTKFMFINNSNMKISQ